MLAAERRTLILEKLQNDKKVIVSELSSEFEVSEETIRRDLEKLEKEGFAIKSYGGATLNPNNLDMPFGIRKKKNMQGKQIIAGIVKELIEDGEHIILDPSTTAVAIVKALRDKENLTLITNSIEVLLQLPDVSSWEVISTGGILKEDYLALVGPGATEPLHSYNVDKTILSCKGISLEKGITDANELFSQVKRTMLGAANVKILAVDSSKFNVVGFSKICGFEDIDIVVTDIKPAEEWLQFFHANGIKCLYGKEAERG